MKWDRRFLELAEHVAAWSKDPSTKVGCVLVNPHRVVVGLGYNGFPRGVEDREDRLHERTVKYLLVQHAEVNAVLNAAGPTRGTTAYVTHAPCASCTGILIQAGIARVVTNETPADLQERFRESFEASRAMLKEAKVKLHVLDRMVPSPALPPTRPGAGWPSPAAREAFLGRNGGNK